MSGVAVNILGTEYTVFRVKQSDDPVLRDASGYCDYTIKRIVIEDNGGTVRSHDDVDDLGVTEAQTGRHEIAHAFVAESGALPSRMDCEQFVEWMAVISPKYVKACREAGVWQDD